MTFVEPERAIMHPSLPITTRHELLMAADAAVRLDDRPARTRALRLPRIRLYGFVKRSLDVVLAGLLLIALLPLFAVVALVIKLTDGGSVLYRQVRIGRGGREFTFYKFRSMVLNAERYQNQLQQLSHHKDTRTFKVKHDPRITWIGRIIRKTSIDELPQLWNVLRGDMTLVGPRPAVPSEVARYTPYERHRLDVTPGLTCIWQVSGRADLDFAQQVEMDLTYIRNRSLWLDLKLLLRTIPAVISGRGAY